MDLHLENLVRLHKEAKFKELEKKSKQIIKKNNFKINNENYKIHLFYGISLFKNNKVFQSVEIFKKLLDFKEDFEVNFHLGNIYLFTSDLKLSRKYFDKCIKENPNFTDSYIQWLKTFCSDYFETFKKKADYLLEKFPTNLRLLFEVGNIYFDMNEFFIAENIYKKILLDPKHEKNVLVLLRLAACKEISLDIEESIRINENILKLEPELLDAKLNLSNLYRSINEKEKASEILKEIISKHPYNFEARRQFSIIHKFEDKNDPNLIFLEKLEKKPFFKNLDEKNKVLYHFTSAKAFEDINDYKNSSAHLKKGNQLRRKNIFYNEKATFQQFDEIKNFINKDIVEQYKSGGESAKPIFIIGMPRSGTTLVEQIISSHSQVFGAGELFYFQRLIKRYFPEAEPKKFVESLKKDLPLYSSIIHDEYLKSLNHFKLDEMKQYITDKNPFNFILVGLIKIIFPKSKIIYCKRNPQDNCLSIYKNYFPMSGIGFAYDENELTRYYHKHLELMHHYISVFENQIYTIQYEDLIYNNKIEVEKLLNYLGLSWENACLEFYKNKNIVKTLSTSQVRSKISSGSINSWKKFENFLPILFKNL